MPPQIHIRVYRNVGRYSLSHRLIYSHYILVWAFGTITESLQRGPHTPRMAFSDSQRENGVHRRSQLPQHQTVELGTEWDALRRLCAPTWKDRLVVLVNSTLSIPFAELLL